MNGRTKKLSGRELKKGFPGLVALLLSSGLALAVFAAAGMVPAGCDNLAGAESAGMIGTSGIVLNSAGAPPPTAGDSSARKITVTFKVLNGGWGIAQWCGIVGTPDDKILVWTNADFADDMNITNDGISADAPYLTIRWRGVYWGVSDYYMKGKLKLNDADKYIVTIDFNHALFGSGWNINTKNLYDVTTWKDDNTDWKETVENADSVIRVEEYVN